MCALKERWPQVLVHVFALIPLAWLLWDFAQGQLTANPIREIQLRTGKYALNLLVLTLACTPVYNVFGLKPVLRLRRLLGTYAFGYAGLHLLNFIGLDYGFNFPLIWADIADKRFVIAGFAAFLILSALVVTSTARWKRQLGMNWKRLHRVVYVAALLAVLHFIWQTKADFRLPLAYGSVVVLLLLLRVPRIKKVTRIRGKYVKSDADSQTMADDF